MTEREKLEIEIQVVKTLNEALSKLVRSLQDNLDYLDVIHDKWDGENENA